MYKYLYRLSLWWKSDFKLLSFSDNENILHTFLKQGRINVHIISFRIQDWKMSILFDSYFFYFSKLIFHLLNIRKCARVNIFCLYILFVFNLKLNKTFWFSVFLPTNLMDCHIYFSIHFHYHWLTVAADKIKINLIEKFVKKNNHKWKRSYHSEFTLSKLKSCPLIVKWKLKRKKKLKANIKHINLQTNKTLKLNKNNMHNNLKMITSLLRPNGNV